MQSGLKRILTIVTLCATVCQSGCAMFENKRMVKLGEAELAGGDHVTLWRVDKSAFGKAPSPGLELKHTEGSKTKVYTRDLTGFAEDSYDLRVASGERKVWVVGSASGTVVLSANLGTREVWGDPSNQPSWAN